VIDRRRLPDLPTPSDNALYMALLVPGVISNTSPTDNAGWANNQPEGSTAFTANGAGYHNSVLYPYLRQNRGIAMSHSIVTDQGTDWRDNDPLLEPLVEIYQGYHAGYEYEGASRTESENYKLVPVHVGFGSAAKTSIGEFCQAAPRRSRIHSTMFSAVMRISTS